MRLAFLKVILQESITIVAYCLSANLCRMEAAMVAIDPMSGAVRVLVGGRDYYESNFNRATQVQILISLLYKKLPARS